MRLPQGRTAKRHTCPIPNKTHLSCVATFSCALSAVACDVASSHKCEVPGDSLGHAHICLVWRLSRARCRQWHETLRPVTGPKTQVIHLGMPVIVLWSEQSHSHRKPFEDFSKPQGIARCLCLRTLLPAPAKRNRTSSAVKRAAGVGCVAPRSAVASVAIHCIHMPPGMLR